MDRKRIESVVRCAPMRLVLLLPLAVGACAATPPAPPVSGVTQPFDPFAFFDGRTEGDGRVRPLFGHEHALSVRGNGEQDGDALVLHQRVEEAGQPVRRRTWRLRRTAPGVYEGTLSDATGPVRGRIEGLRLHLRFRMKGGLTVHQWLTPDPDDHLVLNHMVIRKFGVTVATVDETIRKRGL